MTDSFDFICQSYEVFKHISEIYTAAPKQREVNDT